MEQLIESLTHNITSENELKQELRDKFAIAALQGLLNDTNKAHEVGRIVALAYKYADAMLNEREKKLAVA